MLKKSTALEWLALCLVHCVLGVDSTLTYRFFCRLDDGHHWQDDLHHYFDFCLFENLEHFKLFGGHGPRKRSYAGLVFFSVPRLEKQKLITTKWLRVV